MRFLRRWIGLAFLGVPLLYAWTEVAQARELTRFAAPGGQQSVISIHAATDLAAMEPLIRDFQAANPSVRIDYFEYLTNELFTAAEAECKAGHSTMDLVLSSSVDQLIRLVNEGCAVDHQSAETARLPGWAKWRNEVFGFTTEPAVIVYNRNLVPPEDVPRSRTELIELLRTKGGRYDRKVGSYDVTESGIGYLFAAYDARNGSMAGRLLEAFGRAGLITRCCTSNLLEELAAGRLALGYNLLGSYAYGALLRGMPIGIVIPRDYTLLLSRAVLIPGGALRPAAAFGFLDYLLSERGQQVGREKSFFFGLNTALPPDVDGPGVLASAGMFSPIVIGPELLAVQDRARRARFLEEWTRATR